jgi:GTP-binding protein YchF
MGFKCGIVGLPNVGKSTLFNALTKTAAAQAANYPFCTIEPNTGEVAVPDPRLGKIAEIAKSKEVIPTRISFVDIAGLVRGASKGEGLGNQFLANIREVDAIVHVLRCFEDDDITHVEGRIDPVSDADTVETELMLADLESLERRIVQIRKRATGKEKEALTILPMMEKALALLQDSKPVRLLLDGIAAEDLSILKSLNLLTSKPVLYVCNVAEDDAANGNDASRAVEAMAASQGARTVVISAAIESEIAQLDADRSRKTILEDHGAGRTRARPPDPRRLRTCLNLITYLYRGAEGNPCMDGRPKVRRHHGQRQAKSIPISRSGFIRAQTIAYGDYVSLGGETAAKEAGKARDEGKEYVVQDGDVMFFKFNV